MTVFELSLTASSCNRVKNQHQVGMGYVMLNIRISLYIKCIYTDHCLPIKLDVLLSLCI